MRTLGVTHAEGVEALSLPRLASELRIAAPSSYHHFSDKADILVEVSRLIMASIDCPPEALNGDWIGRSRSCRQTSARQSYDIATQCDRFPSRTFEQG